MLCRRNVLIVLDDVDDLEQLKALAGCHNWFGDGSRIIITTRDEHLLISHRVDEVYPVSLLSHDEAIQLFKRHAYCENNPVEDYEKLSLRVISYVHGLPLVLKILGSFLYGKDKNEWISTLARLKDHPEMDIMEKLKISYDGLEPVEKELFLDIACFFRGESKEKAMEMLDACGFHSRIGVTVLIKKSLITISSDGEFDMHDLVQEMGHHIVRGKHPNNPEKHSRLWRSQEVEDICSRNATTENDMIEVIKYYASDPQSSSFITLLPNLKKLRYLDVNDSCFDEGPTFLSNELKYIKWNSPASVFPESFQPRKLVVLKMGNTLQKDIWKGYKYMRCLKELELMDAKALVRTPDIGGLPCLQKLIITRSDNLEEIHQSLGHHANLAYVSLSSCKKLTRFPSIVRMEKLEILEISDCEALLEFPKIEANMDSLVNLHLDNVGTISSRSWKYDVFLSFRGEDTRKTFVDHLYSALVQQGIYMYKDAAMLVRGESIGPSLLNAIQESKIAVVVFSENYADSSWCLDELAHIMKCREERGLIVIPIFYHIDPSDVRKQKKKFGEAFAKHEKLNNNKVELWRKALRDACDIAGWPIANGHEAKCITEIVSAVLDKLSSLDSVVDDENLVGMGTRLRDLKSHLRIGSGGVRMVGIWGIGGGGKTTLATSLFTEISASFEGCCFLGNIREESSQQHGLKNLQEKILSKVLKTQVGVESVDIGKHTIKDMLCHRNVLIVLDDVDDLEQLEALAGCHNWFGDGSRIIITTRDEHLLISHRVDQIYPISLLSDDEAIRLFRRHAFHKNNPVEDYDELSFLVISYVQGLPLALKILGSFLYGRNKDEWISALAKLKDIPNERIMENLKISYDGLHSVEKELFLDIACFFKGESIDYALEILDACGFHPSIGIKVLIQKALLTISNGRIEMHDLIQKMGHYIIRGEHPSNPEKHSRVWRSQEIEDMCSRVATTENDKIEAMQYYALDHSSSFCKLVSNMKKLRFLHVGSFFEDKDVGGPEFLSNELRYISWENYPASRFPESFQPSNLVVLKLSWNIQKEHVKSYRHQSKLVEESDDMIPHRLPSDNEPILASNSHWWNHDIFLSSIEEYSCNTFVDHLYSDLIEQGINTYKPDRTLSHGKMICPSISKAIEESRIAIIIFSRNYAGSPQCLNELAYIIKCIDKRERNVMPIFYDVSPLDVRDQNGEFGKAFEKQELENMPISGSWRKALVAACNHPGWSLKHIANMHEGNYIKDIVDTISYTLISLVSNGKKDLVGMGTRLQDLKSKLAIGSGDVRMVGIGGMAGCGKTTLASSVYMEISREFECRCFVENIREESRQYGLKRLQQKILSTTLKKEVEVPSDEQGRSMMQSMLCNKNVLIVLDDVVNVDQLKALAGSYDWFGEGSRIIITTRDQNLLADKVDFIYGVSLLSRDEAILLFWRHAYGKYQLIQGYEMLSLDVVSYIGGLPLALKILGSFLYGKSKNEWISFLAKLKDIPNPGLVDMLKICYDGLEHAEKELFLDIACFFRHQPKDEAMMILDAFYFRSHIGVLIQYALISITDGRLDMHDIVQEMGHCIVRGENTRNLEKHTRVWLEEDVQNMCVTDAMEVNKIQALHAPNYYSPSNLLKVVANMKKLRLLNVRQNVKELAEEPLFLSNSLRWISWVNYPASSLPTDFQPTMLFCMILKNGLQKELWEGDKLQHLLNLKVLDLHGSNNLIRTPNFNGLPNLEILVLSSCHNLEEIHSSIGHHEKLVYINLDGCDKLQIFPCMVKLQKLETLILSRCSQLQEFPKIQQSMDGLRHLYMDYSRIEVLPSSIEQYCTNLVFLSLIGCDHLKSIGGNFQLFKHKCLILFSVSDHPAGQKKNVPDHLSAHYYHNQDVEGSSFLSNQLPYICYNEEDPASSFPGSFQPMKPVALKLDARLPKELWKGYKYLPCLKKLELIGAPDLVRTPNFDGLPCLQKLTLSDCRSLEEIHSSLGNHASLVYVSLRSCYKLRTFPTIIRMTKLEILEISNCTVLEFLKIESNMDSLVDLHLEAVGIKVLPSSVVEYCTNLELLKLNYCRYLKSIEGNFQGLKSLKKFDLIGNARLFYLPKDLFDEKCCLEELCIRMTRSDVSSPDLPHLPRFLRKLNLSGLKLEDREIPSEIAELSSLQELHLSYNKFSRLDISLSQLTQLKLLNLSGCYNLIELPELPSNLAILKADNCNSLVALGDIHKHCRWLCQVSLRNVRSVIDGNKLLQSMLQGNAIENHSLSLHFQDVEIAKGFVPPLHRGRRCRLPLPENWCNDFSGFLICAAVNEYFDIYQMITMKHEKQGGSMDTGDSQDEVFWEESVDDTRTWVGHISFCSLRHTAWWDPTSSTVEFFIEYLNPDRFGSTKHESSGFGVALVPRRSQSGPLETKTDSSEFSNEYKCNLSIHHDSKAALVCRFGS